MEKILVSVSFANTKISQCAHCVLSHPIMVQLVLFFYQSELILLRKILCQYLTALIAVLGDIGIVLRSKLSVLFFNGLPLYCLDVIKQAFCGLCLQNHVLEGPQLINSSAANLSCSYFLVFDSVKMMEPFLGFRHGKIWSLQCFQRVDLGQFRVTPFV